MGRCRPVQRSRNRCTVYLFTARSRKTRALKSLNTNNQKMKRLLLASTSTLFGQSYLEYLLPELETFLSGTDTLTFIPYARPGGISHDRYTDLVATALAKINKKVRGLHSYADPVAGIAQAEAIYTGGGNTFLLVQQLYRLRLMPPLKEKIETGMPYFGS